MDVLAAIRTRRSIRRYQDRPVPEELVDLVLRAAMAAPSASNQQPWEFVVINDPAIIKKIPEFNPAALALRSAPIAIVVCGNLERELPQAKDFWVQDCSAAIENLLLAAHANGLSAVWLGIFPLRHLVERIQTLLGLPGSVIPLAVIPTGYPAERKEPEERFDPTRIHWNHWQNLRTRENDGGTLSHCC